jgi:ferredoxin
MRLNRLSLQLNLHFHESNMPSIRIADQVIECDEHENLRRVLLAAKAPLYNGLARMIHCRGLGTCGTCAIEVTGMVSEMTAIEKWRLGFPPHQAGSGLRLACQCQVIGDIEIKKRPGLWGNGKEEAHREQRLRWSMSEEVFDPLAFGRSRFGWACRKTAGFSFVLAPCSPMTRHRRLKSSPR